MIRSAAGKDGIDKGMGKVGKRLRLIGPINERFGKETSNITKVIIQSVNQSAKHRLLLFFSSHASQCVHLLRLARTTVYFPDKNVFAKQVKLTEIFLLFIFSLQSRVILAKQQMMDAMSSMKNQQRRRPFDWSIDWIIMFVSIEVSCRTGMLIQWKSLLYHLFPSAVPW